ncbi:MAG TPA: ATP-binding protein [Fimbriimonas sp.]|nr:ATP-binding protein [Fimbriimonas sp.]
MFSRHAKVRLLDSLSDTPVTLIHGARQTGKSTLADLVADEQGRTRVTLDDPIALSLAKRDPKAFLNTYKPPVTIDEIQRAPELFLAIKLAVDKDRKPGAFMLTGSSNVLAMPRLADSLAGRMAVIDLMPLTQGEIDGTPDGFVDAVFSCHVFPRVVEDDDIFSRIARGGFPEPVQRSPRRRSEWFDSYIRTILERDVKDFANIEALSQMPYLLSLLASRAGSTLNISSLAAETGIAYTSLRRYLSLLENLFLVKLVPAWSVEGGKNLAKTPKAYLVDTGLLCFLTQSSPDSLRSDPLRLRPALENFVAMELAKQCSLGEQRPWLMHLRTVRHLQVDFVLENRAKEIVGVQVKASETLHDGDAEGLRFLRELAGPRFKRGVVLHLGIDRVALDENIEGLPVSALWTT